MIATVGPEEEFAQETLCTLNFASRVRSLKLGRVKKAMQREERTAKLRQQLQLSEARSRRQIADLNKQIANLQGQLADSQQQVHFQRKLTFASFGWSVGVSGVQLGFDRGGRGRGAYCHESVCMLIGLWRLFTLWMFSSSLLSLLLLSGP